jgi:hypothetical protein
MSNITDLEVSRSRGLNPTAGSYLAGRCPFEMRWIQWLDTYLLEALEQHIHLRNL